MCVVRCCCWLLFGACHCVVRALRRVLCAACCIMLGGCNVSVHVCGVSALLAVRCWLLFAARCVLVVCRRWGRCDLYVSRCLVSVVICCWLFAVCCCCVMVGVVVCCLLACVVCCPAFAATFVLLTGV